MSGSRRWSTNQSTQFVTIDETLVLYLASLPREVLRALFDCTLPFTCAEPYFTAPGLVPPESFYGREGERNRIIDQYGSCFVYGGRQLGKTALLQTAQDCIPQPRANVTLPSTSTSRPATLVSPKGAGSHLARSLGCELHQTRCHQPRASYSRADARSWVGHTSRRSRAELARCRRRPPDTTAARRSRRLPKRRPKKMTSSSPPD